MCFFHLSFLIILICFSCLDVLNKLASKDFQSLLLSYIQLFIGVIILSEYCYLVSIIHFLYYFLFIFYLYSIFFLLILSLIEFG